MFRDFSHQGSTKMQIVHPAYSLVRDPPDIIFSTVFSGIPSNNIFMFPVIPLNSIFDKGTKVGLLKPTNTCTVVLCSAIKGSAGNVRATPGMYSWKTSLSVFKTPC